MSTVENDQIINESNYSETEQRENEEEDLEKLILPQNLPLIPPSAVETNFVTYFALGCVLLAWLLHTLLLRMKVESHP